MLRPKINSYKEFDNEKNSCSSKIPTPTPITFLMVCPLISCCRMFVPFQDSGPGCSKDQLHYPPDKSLSIPVDKYYSKSYDVLPSR